MVKASVSRLAALLVAILLVSGSSAAHAEWQQPSGDPNKFQSQPRSSPTFSTTENYPSATCHVYANGTGMGSYCVSGSGSGTSKTLKERFGGLYFDRCRYRPVSKALLSSVPPNPSPDTQRAMMQICLEGIDWDTVTGGAGRSVSFDIVWVKWTTDVKDKGNPLNEYLWSSWDDSAQMPVPHLQAQPIPTPVVGAPTFFTFTWLDPGTQKVVAQGEYANRPEGGPFRRVTFPGGLVMEARAKEITVNPNQDGMDPVTCAADARYTPGSKNGPCELVFDHTSASARDTSTVKIPNDVWNAFWTTVTVTWEVRYGMGKANTPLGDGFTMVLHQELQVQEVQGLNQPPRVKVR